MAVEHAARDERGHRGHLVEREAHAVHLDVVGEAVDPDLRQVDAGRPVDAEGQVEVHGGGVQPIEVGVIEVARLERRRNHGSDQAEGLRAPQRRDRVVDPLDRHDGDAVEASVALAAPVGDPLVVELAEAVGDPAVRDARRAQAEAREEDHLVDAVAVGVGERAGGRPRVDPLDLAEPVLRRAAGARPLRLGVAPALGEQLSPGAERECLRPAREALAHQRLALDDMGVGVDELDGHAVRVARGRFRRQASVVRVLGLSRSARRPW